MKNRRIIIAAFLCLSMLIVGVGYAGVVSHLSVSGTGQFNYAAAQEGLSSNLVFSDAKVIKHGQAYKEDVVEDEASVQESNGKYVATFSAKTLATTDDEAIFQYKLTNNSVDDMELSVHTKHDTGAPNPGNSTFYQFESVMVYADESLTNGVELLGDETQKVDLASEASVIIQVKITLISQPESTMEDPEYLSMHISAETVNN